uniref:Uncharacterized protein n=1 Tax=Anguilla anguilla TaxID=7936 RepID=A0A0E9RT75_ANGAN
MTIKMISKNFSAGKHPRSIATV